MNPNIYDYLNYRKFIRDFYEEKKKVSKIFSFQYFADKAGLKSRAFLCNIINGDKPLPKASIFKTAQTMGLKKKEAEYFERLVHFNEAKTSKEREIYFSRLQNIVPKAVSVELRENQFKYFSEWYHVVIRALVDICKDRDDFAKQAKFLIPGIANKQVEKSVNLLMDLGLIRKKAGNRFEVVNQSITTGEEVKDLGVRKFQKETLKMALDGFEKCKESQKDYSTLTVGISEQGLAAIKERIRNFRKEIIQFVQKDEPADRVYQLNFQLFPLSRTYSKEGVK